MGVSEHTQLVNKVIGLCQDTACWPGVLRGLGYNVQLIEKPISLLESAQKIAPDVVVVSDKLLHAMVIDCKSGTNIESDQDRRYESLESHDLTYHVTVHDPNQLTHVACYADGAANHESLEPHTKLPFITFGPKEVCGKRDFGKKEVNDILHKGVSLKDKLEPTGHYPFSPADEDSAIIPHVLAGLVSYLFQRGRKSPPTITDADMAEAILTSIHPFHKQMYSRHKQKLAQRIKRMIELCKNSNDDFRHQLDKIESGNANHNMIQRLGRICKEMIDKHEQQKLIDNF